MILDDLKDTRPFHRFRIKPQEDHSGVNVGYYDIFLDDRPLKGVKYLKVMMGVDEVPCVILTMMVSDVDLEAGNGRMEMIMSEC